MSPTFALAAGRDPATFLGGVLATPSGDLDLKAELDAGGGVIVTDDPHKIAALDNHRAIERVGEDVDDGLPRSATPEALELAEHNTREELEAIAADHSIENPSAPANKLELAELIVAAQAAGFSPPQPAPDQAGQTGDDSQA